MRLLLPLPLLAAMLLPLLAAMLLLLLLLLLAACQRQTGCAGGGGTSGGRVAAAACALEVAGCSPAACTHAARDVAAVCSAIGTRGRRSCERKVERRSWGRRQAQEPVLMYVGGGKRCTPRDSGGLHDTELCERASLSTALL